MIVNEAPYYARVLRAYERLKVKYDRVKKERDIHFDNSQDLRNELAENTRERRSQVREAELAIARVLALLRYADMRLRRAHDYEGADKIAEWSDHFRQNYFPVANLKEQLDTLEAWCAALENDDKSSMADLHMASRNLIKRARG